MTAPTTETAERVSTTTDNPAGQPPANAPEQADERVSVVVDTPAPDVSSTDTSTDVEDQGDDTADDTSKAGREAARYRTQLRETETERDQLRDQLAAQQRAIVDRHAKMDPALLDAAGLDMADLLDAETGHVDLAAVEAFAAAARARFNVAQGFTPDRAQGHGGGLVPPPKASVADAFKR
jgi:hypothetical protein